MPSRIRAENVLAQADRAALRTELLERAHAWSPRPRPTPRPLITIAREHGALGTLAERVAADLGFKLWHKELLEAIAAEAGVEGDRLADNDERGHTALDQTLTEWLFGADRSQTHYLSSLRWVVRGIERQGSAVIVGRGANFLLQERSTLRVRVVAPLEARAAAIAAEKGVAHDSALREARRVDREREAFVRRAYRRDARDPTEYDLVVNTGSMPVEVAARVVVDCYRDRFGHVGREVAEQPTHA